MPITHILFDCDNTLVLSEDIAFEVCTSVVNEVLNDRNISKRFTPDELMHTFVGSNFRTILKHVSELYDFTLSEQQLDELVVKETSTITKILGEEVVPCVGSMEVLQKLHNDKKYGLAVVSSSALGRINASIKKTKQDIFFAPEHIFSAASSLSPPSCKPDPAIYTHACTKIGKNPSECVAVEDSRSGTLSAVRAGIPVIGYVGCYPEEKQEEMSKKLKEAGATHVIHHWSEFEECLSQF